MADDKSQWRSRASQLVQDMNAGLHAEIVSVSSFAKAVGVARQTIWREDGLREAVEETLSRRASGAANRDDRLRKLQAQIERLSQENELLTSTIICMWEVTLRHGLDPVQIFNDVQARAVVEAARSRG